MSRRRAQSAVRVLHGASRWKESLERGGRRSNWMETPRREKPPSENLTQPPFVDLDRNSTKVFSFWTYITKEAGRFAWIRGAVAKDMQERLAILIGPSYPIATESQLQYCNDRSAFALPESPANGCGFSPFLRPPFSEQAVFSPCRDVHIGAARVRGLNRP